jgi:predicted nucleic acid-binding protein
VTITERAIFDTNVVYAAVVYAALRSPRGASRLLLRRVLDGPLTLHLTVPLLLEYNEVLVRERRAIGVTHGDVTVLLAAIAEATQWHEVHYLWRPFVDDPDDAHVLEAAMAASCPNLVTFHALVTFNTKDFTQAPMLGVEELKRTTHALRLPRNDLVEPT